MNPEEQILVDPTMTVMFYINFDKSHIIDISLQEYHVIGDTYVPSGNMLPKITDFEFKSVTLWFDVAAQKIIIDEDYGWKAIRHFGFKLTDAAWDDAMAKLSAYVGYTVPATPNPLAEL
jgi:hypothetical protein